MRQQSGDYDPVVDPETVARLAMQIPALKRTPRSGWLGRGIAPGEVESVAAHTAGVGLMALMLAELVDVPIDRGRLLSICLLHDLAEAVIGDLPWPAQRYFDPGVKAEAEARALRDMLAGLPFAADWLALWQDFEDAGSNEAWLARTLTGSTCCFRLPRTNSLVGAAWRSSGMALLAMTGISRLQCRSSSS